MRTTFRPCEPNQRRLAPDMRDRRPKGYFAHHVSDAARPRAFGRWMVSTSSKRYDADVYGRGEVQW